MHEVEGLEVPNEVNGWNEVDAVERVGLDGMGRLDGVSVNGMRWVVSFMDVSRNI